jgi:class 3 adenylate cyclase
VRPLSEQELVTRSGTDLERIRQLARAGILVPATDGSFSLSDINRVRLADALDRVGISPEDLGRAIEERQLSFEFMDDLFSEPIPMRDQTIDEWAAALGVGLDDLGRLYTSWSLPAPVSGQRVREDDARMLEALTVFPGTGLDTEILVAATRFFGDNLRRIAESQVRFFKSNIIDPMTNSGVPLNEVLETVAPMSAALQPAARVLLAWLHGRHFESHVFQETVLMVEQIMESAGYTRRRAVSPPAIAFVDLSGYTRLTEESGDQAAALLAEGLAQMVNEAAQSHRGRVVKLLGDGVMFFFPDPADAIRCGLAMVDRASAAGLPKARVGVNAGDVVYRDGDYFGRTVNVAARIVDYARPGEVLASEEAVNGEADGVAFEAIGSVLLRGLEEPVQVLRATRRQTG